MKSRENSLKHGLTGAGVVLPQRDQAEVDRRFDAYAREAQARGEIGLALARLMAVNSLRMERAADQQAAALTERIRGIEADFVAPEGVDEATAARLKAEAVRVAMFDPSPEAILAQKYEATAVRTFFKCLKELKERELRERKELEKRPPEVREEAGLDADEKALLGSILEMKREATRMEAEFADLGVDLPPIPPALSRFIQQRAGVDVPFAIGRPG